MKANYLKWLIVAVGLCLLGCGDRSTLGEASAPPDQPSNRDGIQAPGADEGTDTMTAENREHQDQTETSGSPDAAHEPEESASQPTAPASPPAPSIALDEYFPLEPDKRWDYQVEIRRAGKEPISSSATKSVGGTRTLGDCQYVRVLTKTQPPMPVPDQLYRTGEEGIYAAVQGAPGKEMLILPKQPATVGPWSGEALPVIKDFVGKATVNESYRAAGREYRDCIRVSLTMTIVERTLFGGTNEVPVRLDRWFAAGAGMVAEVREVGAEGKPNHLVTVSSLRSPEDPQ